ncbi:hypothetical protein [Candidatus Methylocalor cossyra]
MRPAGVSLLSANPLRGLAALYGSTFVDRMQEHFRQMLQGAYSVYVTALGEGFDPTLRAHLSDVLQDLVGRSSELAEAFAEEMLHQFQRTIGALAISEATAGHPPSPPRSEILAGLDDDPKIREFVARTVRKTETRHGSLMLAVTRTFMKLVDRNVEEFLPPWSPACSFAAFAATLERLDMPVHPRVKLILYQTFAQEVLHHLGDACIAFRDALPSDRSQLRGKEDATLPNTVRLTQGADGEPPGDSAPPGSDSPPFFLTENETDLRPTAPAVVASSSSAAAPAQRPSWWLAPRVRHLAAMALLLGGIALILGSSKRAAQVPGGGDSPMPALGPGRHEIMAPAASSTGSSSTLPPAAVPLPETDSAQAPAAAKPATPQAFPRDPLPSQDLRKKRELLHAVRLKTFRWKVDHSSKKLLFDLSIGNTSTVPVGELEIVCSQYSRNLDFLEAAKTVLSDPIAAGQTKEFRAVPIGFANRQTERINCLIADLSNLAEP